MGIPFSKQIHAAIEQVQPISQNALLVIEQLKLITLVGLLLNVASVILLSLILIAMIALLYTVNEDLVAERKALVDPAMKWLAYWFMMVFYHRYLIFIYLCILLIGPMFFIFRSKFLQNVGVVEYEEEEVES